MTSETALIPPRDNPLQEGKPSILPVGRRRECLRGPSLNRRDGRGGFAPMGSGMAHSWLHTASGKGSPMLRDNPNGGLSRAGEKDLPWADAYGGLALIVGWNDGTCGLSKGRGLLGSGQGSPFGFPRPGPKLDARSRRDKKGDQIIRIALWRR